LVLPAFEPQNRSDLAPVIGVGAAAWAIASIFDNDNEGESNGSNAAESRSEPYKQPLKRNRSTVQNTVREPFGTAETTVAAEDNRTLDPVLLVEGADTTTQRIEGKPFDLSNNQETILDAASLDDEAAKKEMIRQTMSELGKRSAASRARKKLQIKQ